MRKVTGFALLLIAILLLFFVGSVMPVSWTSLSVALGALAIAAGGLRLLWRPTDRG